MFLFQVSNPKFVIWKFNNLDEYFKRVSGNDWIETKNGTLYASFKFIQQTDDYVILRRTDNLYVRISQNNASFAIKLYDFIVYQYGKWIF